MQHHMHSNDQYSMLHFLSLLAQKTGFTIKPLPARVSEVTS